MLSLSDFVGPSFSESGITRDHFFSPSTAEEALVM
ncbi:MAG: hypothetical protein ACJAT0_000969 [Nonlabens sp.]|jgi:hypothetical protein